MMKQKLIGINNLKNSVNMSTVSKIWASPIKDAALYSANEASAKPIKAPYLAKPIRPAGWWIKPIQGE